MGNVSIQARLLFIALWNYVDDSGIGIDEVELIVAAHRPYDDHSRALDESSRALDELAREGVILRYVVDETKGALTKSDDGSKGALTKSSDGSKGALTKFVSHPGKSKPYLIVCNWAEHQRIDRPTRSRYPMPDHPLARLREPPTSADATRDESSTNPREPSTNPREPSTSPRAVVTYGAVEVGTRNLEKDLKPSSSLVAEATTRPDVERLCARLADRIEANGSRRPTVTAAWRTEARRLLDLDGRTEADVARCIDWCQADPFWRSNILSMPKLRKQYDMLRLKAQEARSGQRRSTTDERVAQALTVAERFKERDCEQALPGVTDLFELRTEGKGEQLAIEGEATWSAVTE